MIHIWIILKKRIEIIFPEKTKLEALYIQKLVLRITSLKLAIKIVSKTVIFVMHCNEPYKLQAYECVTSINVSWYHH